jgi:probable phosphoglycerate mutase
MARLLLIRHAPTAETGKSLSGRLPGFSLTEAGREMADDLGRRLTTVALAALYSSPLERTWETAQAIARHQRRGTARTVVQQTGLIEVDYGTWSGRPFRTLYKLAGWQTVRTAPSRIRFPGGESLLEAQARAVSTCEELARAHRGKVIGLVTHADVIKAAIAHFLGQPLDLFNRLEVSPASVSVLDLAPDRPPRLVALNTSGHPSSWPEKI